MLGLELAGLAGGDALLAPALDGTANWLSTANWQQIQSNTGVCGEAIQESVPDVIKCLQVPAKLLGALRTTYHYLESVYRGEQKPRTFIHI